MIQKVTAAQARFLPLQGGVDCWIDVADDAEQRIVRLAGHLRSEQVPDLAAVCSHADGRRLCLDLSDLLNADAVGIAALRRLHREGSVLVRVPEYIRLRLEALE